MGSGGLCVSCHMMYKKSERNGNPFAIVLIEDETVCGPVLHAGDPAAPEGKWRDLLSLVIMTAASGANTHGNLASQSGARFWE